MPIPKRWTRFTLDNVLKVKDIPGAYELANRAGRIIDSGGSDVSVRDRLLKHLQTNKYPTAVYFRVQYSGWLERGTELEAYHTDKFRKKHGRRPRYTKRSPRRRLGFL